MTRRIADSIERMRAFIADKDDAWSMPDEAMRFLHGLVLARRPARCVEIGTSYGHSGLWIAAALNETGGTLVTIDRDARKSGLASNTFADAGLSEIVTCRTGDARSILADIDGPIDFVLNDADKEGVRDYAELVYPKLTIGGIIVTDNASSHQEVRDRLSRWIRADARFASALADVGNGLEVSIKVA